MRYRATVKKALSISEHASCVSSSSPLSSELLFSMQTLCHAISFCVSKWDFSPAFKDGLFDWWKAIVAGGNKRQQGQSAVPKADGRSPSVATAILPPPPPPPPQHAQHVSVATNTSPHTHCCVRSELTLPAVTTVGRMTSYSPASYLDRECATLCLLFCDESQLSSRTQSPGDVHSLVLTWGTLEHPDTSGA